MVTEIQTRKVEKAKQSEKAKKRLLVQYRRKNSKREPCDNKSAYSSIVYEVYTTVEKSSPNSISRFTAVPALQSAMTVRLGRRNPSTIQSNRR